MKIEKITSMYRNDFSAVLSCEHCGSTQELTTGYNDAYYHNEVLPHAIYCKACGKNRLGAQRKESA